jgi:TrmH family RNA methyltransferase
LSVLDHLNVVLVSPRNPLNIGACARAMSNFGFMTLRLVNPYNVAFREARSAVGASAVLARAKEFQTVAEAVEDCSLVIGTTSARLRQPLQPLRPLPDGGRLIRSRLASQRIALLFGSEKHGLSNVDLSHCHWLIRIPTRTEHSSMNLGQAVAVCLYELVRANRPKSAVRNAKPANAKEVEAITQRLFEALRQSGYVNPQSASRTEDRIRREVRRLGIPADAAPDWLGMLNQILWKLRRA